MPTVPRSNVSAFPGAKGDMPVAPTQGDLFMALGILHAQGRLAPDQVPGATFDQRFRGTQPSVKDRLDPSLQGEVEDRRGFHGLDVGASVGVQGGSR